MKLRYSRRAIRDLNQIYEYIARDSAISAVGVAHDIRAAVDNLKQWPLSGHGTERPGIYRLVVPRQRYLVTYMIRSTEIIILTIRHEAT